MRFPLGTYKDGHSCFRLWGWWTTEPELNREEMADSGDSRGSQGDHPFPTVVGLLWDSLC